MRRAVARHKHRSSSTPAPDSGHDRTSPTPPAPEPNLPAIHLTSHEPPPSTNITKPINKIIYNKKPQRQKTIIAKTFLYPPLFICLNTFPLALLLSFCGLPLSPLSPSPRSAPPLAPPRPPRPPLAPPLPRGVGANVTSLSPNTFAACVRATGALPCPACPPATLAPRRNLRCASRVLVTRRLDMIHVATTRCRRTRRRGCGRRSRLVRGWR